LFTRTRDEKAKNEECGVKLKGKGNRKSLKNRNIKETMKGIVGDQWLLFFYGTPGNQ